MSLIDAERDDDALLAAEDEAIRAAARPPEPEPSWPLPNPKVPWVLNQKDRDLLRTMRIDPEKEPPPPAEPPVISVLERA